LLFFWICTWLNKTIISNFKNACLYGLQFVMLFMLFFNYLLLKFLTCTLSFKYQRNEGWNCGAYLACQTMDRCCRLHLITHIHLFMPLKKFCVNLCSIIVTILLQTPLWPYLASHIGEMLFLLVMAILVHMNTPRRSTMMKRACTYYRR
jgi:hypothetical protein